MEKHEVLRTVIELEAILKQKELDKEMLIKSISTKAEQLYYKTYKDIKLAMLSIQSKELQIEQTKLILEEIKLLHNID